MKRKVVFLSLELSRYWISGLDKLEDIFEVTVFHYPTNAEAPFQLVMKSYYIENTGNKQELSQEIAFFSPDLIICSGWVNKVYLSICKDFVKDIPVVLGIDNPWEASFKQRVNKLLSFRLHKFFNAAWGAGPSQIKYLRKLGFKEVQDGFYTADTPVFQNIYRKRIKTNRTKKFICVARYIPQKNYEVLWEAFSKVAQNYPDWELHCFGTGDNFAKRILHPNIIHHGFVQPEDMENHLIDAAAFILPSKIEHWGVVVHEMAAAGLPLLLSDKVEAGKRFLISGKNGIQFDPFSVQSIEKAILKFIDLPEADKKRMEEKSAALGASYTPADWAKKVLNFL